MKRDEIIRMAQSARLGVFCLDDGSTIEALERFGAMVAAAERERCAAECEKELISVERFDFHRAHGHGVRDCAAAIRALKDEVSE